MKERMQFVVSGATGIGSSAAAGAAATKLLHVPTEPLVLLGMVIGGGVYLGVKRMLRYYSFWDNVGLLRV